MIRSYVVDGIAYSDACTNRSRRSNRQRGPVPTALTTRVPTRAVKLSATVSTARFARRAARWVYEGKRLDMQALADELGVSRATLFRRVGCREELLSQALWVLAKRTMEIAAERWQ